jgi:hypothetical protein
MRREREAMIGEDAFLPEIPPELRVRKTHKARGIVENKHSTDDESTTEMLN